MNFDQRGFTVEVLETILPHIEQDWKTYDVCTHFIKPKTKDYNCSYVELTSRSKPECVGIANLFISHAWGYNFKSVAEEIIRYTKQNKQTKFFIWFDVICNNQNVINKVIECAELEIIFRQAVISIGNVLIVLFPMHAPIALKRSWCLFEIFTAISSEIKFEIALQSSEDNKFLDIVFDRPYEIVKYLSNVDIETAEATVEADRATILELIVKKVGVHQMNSIICSKMRDWLLEKSRNSIEEINEETCSPENLVLNYLGFGTLMIYLDKHENALSWLLKAKEIYCKQSEYKNDKAYSNILNNIGQCYSNISNFVEAKEWFKLSLQVTEQTKGADNIDCATALNNLAANYDHLSLYQEAYDAHKKVLNLRLNHFGSLHEDTAVSYSNLGRVCIQMNRAEEALNYIKFAYNIRLKIFGELHAETTMTLNSLAYIQNELGHKEAAIEIYKQVLDAQTKVFGEVSQNCAVVLNNIGQTYNEMKKFDDAEIYFLKSIKVKEKLYSPPHQTLAVAYNNMGSLYSNMKRMEDALVYYQKSIKMKIELFGEKHADTARAYNNIGLHYREMGDHVTALKNLQKSLELRKAVLGENHSGVAITLVNIGLCHDDKGEKEIAKGFFKKAYSVCVISLGEDHPTSKQVKQMLSD